MSEYVLKFDATFSDGEAGLVTRVASILAEAKAEILKAENSRMTTEIAELKAEVERLREANRLIDIDEKRPPEGEIVIIDGCAGKSTVGYWITEQDDWESGGEEYEAWFKVLDNGVEFEPIEGEYYPKRWRPLPAAFKETGDDIQNSA